MVRSAMPGRFLFALSAVFLTSALLSSGHPAPAAAVHAKVEIKIHTGTPGTASYIAGFALADLLSKKHPWLRAVVVETAQSADAVKTVARDAQLRKTGIFSVNSIIHNDVVTGKGLFTTPIEYQVLALIRSDAISIVTIDPKIKTMSDLNGKRASLGTRGGPGPVFEALLNAHNVKLSGIEYLSWEPARDAMIDGRIDAAAQTLGDTTLEPYVPPAVIKQLQARRDFHLISMDQRLVQEVSEKTPVGYTKIPSEVFGAPIAAISNKTSWGVCPDFDPEAAYEFVKFMAENAASFKNYDPALACVKRATLADLPIPPLVLHPAAKAYYQANGIKIGQ
jgi:TRAP transporter TAXI family solute receptor